ncbi:MAG: hypothetical protein AVDCRST_MAG78-2675 [uncultured Rubrobacteraceae bacterium]|uniref:Uncharacterized protein n=1 Tax=uncultured Rubrobacteraceae bacterium TaxID=349277 RepID=A0A6J4QKY3_9ACTN|nr:MAG: hypothetical protein AVDCRST_MAG78-2675 [uncultured Rubrobacteraceae bacterium]
MLDGLLELGENTTFGTGRQAYHRDSRGRGRSLLRHDGAE